MTSNTEIDKETDEVKYPGMIEMVETMSSESSTSFSEEGGSPEAVAEEVILEEEAIVVVGDTVVDEPPRLPSYGYRFCKRLFVALLIVLVIIAAAVIGAVALGAKSPFKPPTTSFPTSEPTPTLKAPAPALTTKSPTTSIPTSEPTRSPTKRPAPAYPSLRTYVANGTSLSETRIQTLDYRNVGCLPRVPGLSSISYRNQQQCAHDTFTVRCEKCHAESRFNDPSHYLRNGYDLTAVVAELPSGTTYKDVSGSVSNCEYGVLVGYGGGRTPVLTGFSFHDAARRLELSYVLVRTYKDGAHVKVDVCFGKRGTNSRIDYEINVALVPNEFVAGVLDSGERKKSQGENTLKDLPVPSLYSESNAVMQGFRLTFRKAYPCGFGKCSWIWLRGFEAAARMKGDKMEFAARFYDNDNRPVEDYIYQIYGAQITNRPRGRM